MEEPGEVTIQINGDGMIATCADAASEEEYYVVDGAEEMDWEDLPHDPYPFETVLGRVKNISHRAKPRWNRMLRSPVAPTLILAAIAALAWVVLHYAAQIDKW